MPSPELYYIEGSDEFFRSGYSARTNYSLKLATSLEPDNDLANKNLDFSVVALRLSTRKWGNRNNGILTYNLNLAKSITIPRQGPLPEQVISTLHFAFPFKNAKRGGPVGGMAQKTIFHSVSVADYLSKDGDLEFSLEISLAKSGGSNTNTIVDMASGILRDPAVSAGLATTIPVIGIASAVFEVIRTTFFDSEQARVIWDSTTFQFRGGPGTGYPLKVGRYVFVSTRLNADEVEDFYRYRGKRLVDIRRKSGKQEVKDADQFYLDIYAHQG